MFNDKILFDLFRRFNKKGYELYIVGGAVRDFLLGKTNIKDFDLSTNATPNVIEEILKDYIVDKVGFKYGSIRILGSANSYQITTFRKEKYKKSRYPSKIRFIDSFKKDLKRRDFTINAIGYDFYKIVDPFNFSKDLSKKEIKLIGSSVRFKQDPLRILRAIRLSINLGFDINPRTLKKMDKNKQELEHLSSSIVKKEYSKIDKNRISKKHIPIIKKYFDKEKLK